MNYFFTPKQWDELKKANEFTMNYEFLTLEREFTDEYNIKHTRIYGNKFAYLYEMASSNGKIEFSVFDRLRTAKMPKFEKWNFKNDKEAILKFNELTKNKRGV